MWSSSLPTRLPRALRALAHEAVGHQGRASPSRRAGSRRRQVRASSFRLSCNPRATSSGHERNVAVSNGHSDRAIGGVLGAPGALVGDHLLRVPGQTHWGDPEGRWLVSRPYQGSRRPWLCNRSLRNWVLPVSDRKSVLYRNVWSYMVALSAIA
jgi:hypothetical protein